MSRLNFERKGPSRPGSSTMDHPRNLERPVRVKTEAEKAAKAAQYAERKRALAFKSHVHDFVRYLPRDTAETLAAILTGYKPR